MTQALLISRPDLYVLHVEVGSVAFEGVRPTFRPAFGGDVEGAGAAALLIDSILLAAGMLPAGVLIGVPLE